MENTLKNYGKIRELLYEANFYTEEKINDLLNIIYNSYLKSYISTSHYNYNEKSIQLNMRKTFMCKFEGEQNNSLAFYNIMNECIKEFLTKYKPEVMSIIGNENIDIINSSSISLLYYIARIGENTIIISL